MTAAGAPTLLPVASTGAQLAVDDTGRVYELAAHGDGTSTLHDYRVNADGSLSQEDSAALGADGTLSVEPSGGEAVVITPGFYEGSTNIGGFLFPVGVSTGGALTATSSIHSSGVANTNFNNPQGSSYSPSSSTLYVTNILTGHRLQRAAGRGQHHLSVRDQLGRHADRGDDDAGRDRLGELPQ